MNKPVWLLDVDGVINAWPANRSKVWQDYTVVTVKTPGAAWPICYSPSVIRFINDMHASGLVEVRWLTTWGNQAQQDLSYQLGLDHFMVQAAYMQSSLPWWKLSAALGVAVDEGTPVVWTDDDISEYSSHVRAYEADFKDSLILSPLTSVGLAPAHLKHIARYLAN